LKEIECEKYRIFEKNEKNGKKKITYREKMKKVDDFLEIQGDVTNEVLSARYNKTKS
jgi:hypothetical protein